MADLEQVVRIERGGQPFITLVICDGIQPFGREVLCKILPVDNFAHQEKVFPLLPHGAAQKFKEPFGQKVCHVQTQPVDAEFVDPESDGAGKVIGHLAAMQVEFDKLVMPFPTFVPEPVVILRIPAEPDVEPILFIGLFAPPAHVLKGKKAPAYVVEHAVQHDADARLVEFFHKRFEVRIVAEAPVHVEKVYGIVAVALAFEQRVEQHGVKSLFLYLRDALFDLAEAVTHRAEVVFALTAAVAERIDLVKNTLVKPHTSLFCSRSEAGRIFTVSFRKAVLCPSFPKAPRRAPYR